uniref:Putative secreted peptide n=1 Tax=Anopheles braziliensis TaxID=58242 RepID=A0A2M3ZNX5_9DIPT
MMVHWHVLQRYVVWFLLLDRRGMLLLLLLLLLLAECLQHLIGNRGRFLYRRCIELKVHVVEILLTVLQRRFFLLLIVIARHCQQNGSGRRGTFAQPGAAQ